MRIALVSEYQTKQRLCAQREPGARVFPTRIDYCLTDRLSERFINLRLDANRERPSRATASQPQVVVSALTSFRQHSDEFRATFVELPPSSQLVRVQKC